MTEDKWSATNVHIDSLGPDETEVGSSKIKWVDPVSAVQLKSKAE